MWSHSVITWPRPLQTGSWLSWLFLASCCCCYWSESAGVSAVRTHAAATSVAPAAPNAAAVLEHVSFEKGSELGIPAIRHRSRLSVTVVSFLCDIKVVWFPRMECFAQIWASASSKIQALCRETHLDSIFGIFGSLCWNIWLKQMWNSKSSSSFVVAEHN